MDYLEMSDEMKDIKHIDDLRIQPTGDIGKSIAEKMHWVRCCICGTQWVAVGDEEASTRICYRSECHNSFEAKVVRATKQV